MSLLQEIIIVKQKILFEMENTKTPNADRDSCIQSFLQACDAFARVHEHSNKSSKNKEERSASSDRRRGSATKEEQRKTIVKFDLSKNEVFLF
ncbi:predicted protein [Chaetoceros tenuissimus]|uniref:Uncharacterized protein n=1 Tax=Chaetoceros tenuissimus TaxID=426638 RepID=A0AAD3H721_9STRA|nr:predicted protein [Chaetoceros tenuissimus]